RGLVELRGLPGTVFVPGVQGGDLQLLPLLAAQLQDRDRLVAAAEVGVRLAEDLHRHAGAVPVLEQKVACPDEVFVRVVARLHFLDGQVEDRGIETRLAGGGHQGHSSVTWYLSARRCIQRTANASTSARQARFHIPYLVRPERRGRWRTGSSAARPPGSFTGVGRA